MKWATAYKSLRKRPEASPKRESEENVGKYPSAGVTWKWTSKFWNMENFLQLSGLCVAYEWEMTFCVSCLGTHESHSHVYPWLVLKKSQIYAYRLFGIGTAKPKCEPVRLSQPMSDIFWEKTTEKVSYYYRAKCEQLEWHTLMIRHTTQTQYPAKLICHITFVNIHSRPCELCQVLEECSDLMLTWQAVQQDFHLRSTFMRKLSLTFPIYRFCGSFESHPKAKRYTFEVLLTQTWRIRVSIPIHFNCSCSVFIRPSMENDALGNRPCRFDILPAGLTKLHETLTPWTLTASPHLATNKSNSKCKMLCIIKNT